MKRIRGAKINPFIRAFVLALGLTATTALVPQSLLAQQNEQQAQQKSGPGATKTPGHGKPDNDSQFDNDNRDEEDVPGCLYDRNDLQLLV